MRLLLILLLLLHAQAGLSVEVLDEISAQLVKTEITEGRFRQEKTITVLKKPLLSAGTFTYHQKHGVIWQTLTPVHSLLLVNQTHLVTAQGEQTLPPAFGRVFTAMLGGNLGLLNEGFKISGTRSKGNWQLQLVPKDALVKKIIAGMRLQGGRELQQLEIREANGNSTRIAFEHITHPMTLTPAQEADFERLSSPR